MLGEFSNGPVRGGVAVQRDGMRPSRMRCRVKDWRGADALTSVRFQPLPIRTAREVFPQAAHPASFTEGVMGLVDLRRPLSREAQSTW